METRNLGNSGLHLSVLGFGAMTWDGQGAFAAFGRTKEEQARREIDIVIDEGVNLIDTADIYSGGRSEEMLGEVLGARRKDLLIATKVYGRTGGGAGDVGLSRRHIISACEASLRRLRTDWIDLYHAHNFDGLVPLEETLRAFDDLVRSGKVRHVACSNFLAWELTKSIGLAERLGLARFVGQQIQYSLLVRDAETEMLPAGLDLGVGALVWSPLAGGYLSGKFRAGDVRGSRVTKLGRLPALDGGRGRHVVDALYQIADAHQGASPSQVAINWLLARAGVTSVLIGVTAEDQLRDILAATRWSLTDAEVTLLDDASAVDPGYPRSQRARFHPERNPDPFA